MPEASLATSFSQENLRDDEEKGAKHIYANTFFPGNIPTEAVDSWKELTVPILGNTMKGLFQIVGQSPTDAAATAIYLSDYSRSRQKDSKRKILHS
jgi:hypothetical protein